MSEYQKFCIGIKSAQYHNIKAGYYWIPKRCCSELKIRHGNDYFNDGSFIFLDSCLCYNGYLKVANNGKLILQTNCRRKIECQN